MGHVFGTHVQDTFHPLLHSFPNSEPEFNTANLLFHLLCRLMTTEETNQNTGFGEAYFIDIVKDSKL